ncbi:MAG: hypothetical protein AAGH87_05105 [Pseudomonadota bacterium]
MTNYDDTPRASTQSGRFGRWLSTRPAETWMFFAAGVLLGGFIL